MSLVADGQGYLGNPPVNIRKNKFMVIENNVHEIHDVIVHKFTMGDVEDPELYAAEPLWNWQQSEQGQWVMAHALEAPVWHQHADQYSYGYRFIIRARLRDDDYLIYKLKWG
jgi:hypothetical protein